MEEIQTASTSANTADCTPIVLREKERVRLLFRPTLVANAKDPKACIDGSFVYERRAAAGEWQSANTESLGTIKAGEQYKLELHAAELLRLMEGLGPLYRASWQDSGIRAGKHTLVRMEAGLARFLKLGQSQLDAFLNAHPDDAVSVFCKLLEWVSAGSLSTDASAALQGVDPAKLPAVSALLGLSALKAALHEWEANKSNSSESFWQSTLAKHSFVLSQLFAHPVVVIQERAYLGGKSLDDTGGSYLDFLAASKATDAIVLVEIKTPSTALLGPEYRTDAWPPSPELAGALAQVLKYRNTMTTEFSKLGRMSDRDLVLGGAPCLVIAGDATRELDTPAKRESFEAFRSQLSAVRVVTYDELFEKLHVSSQLLEGLPKSGG